MDYRNGLTRTKMSEYQVRVTFAISIGREGPLRVHDLLDRVFVEKSNPERTPPLRASVCLECAPRRAAAALESERLSRVNNSELRSELGATIPNFGPSYLEFGMDYR